MGAGRCSVGARREAEEGLPRELAGDDGEAHDLADVVGGGDLHVDGGVDGEMALFERGGELQLAVLGGGEGTLGERAAVAVADQRDTGSARQAADGQLGGEGERFAERPPDMQGRCAAARS